MHINFGDIPVFFPFFFFPSARYPFGRQPNFATDAKITLRFSMPRAYTLTEKTSCPDSYGNVQKVVLLFVSEAKGRSLKLFKWR